MKKVRAIVRQKLAKTLTVLFIFLFVLSSHLPFLSEFLSPPPAFAAESCSASDLQAYLSARVGGVALDQAAVFLADMTEITGAYYDAGDDRIVFVGKKNTSAPKFDKDDLAVAIRAIFFKNSIPWVSMEFKDPNNITGDPNMNVLYGGGIEDTQFGKVLVDADYRLKMYVQGYEQNGQKLISSVPGYKSHFDRWLEKGPTPNTKTLSRWWISPQLITLKEDDATSSFVFDQVKMQVRTEGLLSTNDPAWNQAAIEFSQHQTDYYDLYANESAPYYQAKQLGKIVSVIKWLKDNNITTDFNWARDYQPKFVSTPREIPRLTTPWVERNGYQWSMTGGVDYYTSNTYNPDDGTATSIKNSSEAVGAPKEDVNWQFTNAGQNYEAVAVSAQAFRSLGGYTTSATDLSFPTAGDLKLGFDRSYSSLGSAQKGIGRGWEMLPARLTDNKPGWTLTCSDGQIGQHVWKMGLQTQAGLYETFTYYNCTVGYTTDKPEYHSQLFHNSDGTYTARVKDQTEYTFNSTLQLIAVKDKSGNSISYSYDGSGKLTSISDGAHTLTLSYNSQGLVSQVADWTGRKVQYGYDAQSNLTTVTDPRGGTTTYAYDENNKLASIKDRTGQTLVQNTFTPESKLATQKPANGAQVSYAYDLVAKTINLSDTSGRTGKMIYDDKARILSQFDAFNNSVTYTYGNEYAPLTIKDRRGTTITYAYDTAGNATSLTFPDGKRINYTYDSKNNITKIEDYRYGTSPKTSNFTYDGGGRLTQKSEAGILTSYTYDAKGEITSQKNHLNQTTTFTRDSFGNVFTSVDPLSSTTRFEYDVLARITKSTDPEGKVTSWGYDANNNVVTAADGAGVTTLTYDSENRLSTMTSPTTAVSQYLYNSAGSLVGVKDPLNNTTSYGYDVYQNLLSAQDALTRTTSYTYDKLDRAIAETTDLGKITRWEYDVNSNITKRTDAKNQVTTYAYDAFNRLATITYPGPVSVTFAYDSRGNRTQMVDPVGTTSFVYDAFDRLTQVSNPYGRVISYTYDALGNLQAITYPDSKAVQYVYDASNRLTKVTDWNNQSVNYTYFKNGLITSKQMPNGVSALYTYDGANRLASLEYMKSGGQLAKFTYERNGVGNITKVTEVGSAFGLPQPTSTPTPTPSSGPTPSPTPAPSPTPTPTGSPKPDLVVISLTASVQNPAVGQSFNAVATVKNQGNASTPLGYLRIGYYYDLPSPPTTTTPYNHARYTITSLAPGQTFTFTQPLSFATSGQHSIQVLIDRLNSISESNETNNVGGPIYVQVGTQAYIPQLRDILAGFTVNQVYAQTPARVTTYTYDLLERLTGAQYPDSSTYVYTFDASDNRLKQSVGTQTTSYTYNDDNQLTAFASATLTYDNNGNLTGLTGTGTASLSYNFENLPTGVTRTTQSSSQESTYTLSTSLFSGIDVGSDSTPTFVDIDADGDFDLFVGKSTGTISYYKNTGTGQAPVFSLVSTSYSAIDVGDYSVPAFADLDGDGDQDLLIGEYTGNINYYKNTGSSTAPTFTLNTANLGNIDIGSYSSPTLVNIDADGDKDLFVGENLGTLKYYKNTGNTTSPTFTLETSFPVLDAGSDSNPAFVDYDGDGDWDLFVGNADGNIVFYRNTGTAAAPAFTQVSTNFGAIDIGIDAAPTFTDLDADSDKDLYIGEDPGTINYYVATPAGATSTTSSYTYDGLGNRLQKNVGTTATRYVNDTSGSLSRVLVETNAANTIQKYYVYGMGQASEGGSSSTNRVYPLTDGIGNTRFLTDSSGNITKTYEYDPFGNMRVSSGTGSTNFQFVGEQIDPDAELVYLRARYYDPATGRFISKDPVGGLLTNSQTQNPYAYSLNDPVNLADPSGKFAIAPILLAAWAVAEIGMTAADANDFANTLQDPNANLCDKAWSGALFAAGIIGPGAGYGQAHHILSNPIMKALDEHKTLKGIFQRNDFIVQAADKSSHWGYQTWHRVYDSEVVDWLATHGNASKGQFVDFLRGIYSQSDILQRFPGVLDILK